MLWNRKARKLADGGSGHRAAPLDLGAAAAVAAGPVDALRAVPAPPAADDPSEQRERLLLEKLQTLAKEQHRSHRSRAERPADRLVWVIDDDIAVQALLRSLFGREGYTVTTSGSVAEAMTSMPEASACHLIVLDFNIPGGSGLDVLRELRRRSDSPVVMVSNIRRPELLAQAFELGANEFVEKPFDPRSLLVRARRLLD